MDWISSVKATFAKKEAHGASSIKKKKKPKPTHQIISKLCTNFESISKAINTIYCRLKMLAIQYQNVTLYKMLVKVSKVK